MPTSRSRRLFVLLTLTVFSSSSSLAQEAKQPDAKLEQKARLEVKRETLQIPGAAKKTVSRAQMINTARDVTRGYYNALIAAKYEEAAGFLHPAAMEPLRARVLEDLEKSPPQKTQNTLGALGVKDLNTLRTMSLDAFYVAWAKSPYGEGIQVLSKKDLAVDVVLDPPSCNEQGRVCEINLKLRGRNEKGEKMEVPSTVWVVEHEGRWLLTLKPPA